MAYINVDEVYILDNTGAQVDAVTDIPFKADAGLTAAQQAQARANLGISAGGGVNRNLLDNPWFTVNQRSITSGSNPSATAVYTRDRWKIARCSSYVFNDNGTVTTSWDGTGSGCYLIQYAFPDTAAMLRGKTVTLSVYVGGTLYTKTLTLPNQTNNSFVIGDGLSVNIADVIASGRGYECQFYHSVSAGKTIGPFKLELGTTSTLAQDAPPDYGTELVKCMRYFQRIKVTTAWFPVAFGICESSVKAKMLIPTGVPMRTGTTPTLSSSGAAKVVGNNSASLDVTSFSFVEFTANGIGVRANVSSGLSDHKTYSLYLSQNAYIDVSADL